MAWVGKLAILAVQASGATDAQQALALVNQMLALIEKVIDGEVNWDRSEAV